MTNLNQRPPDRSQSIPTSRLPGLDRCPAHRPQMREMIVYHRRPTAGDQRRRADIQTRLTGGGGWPGSGEREAEHGGRRPQPLFGELGCGDRGTANRRQLRAGRPLATAGRRQRSGVAEWTFDWCWDRAGAEPGLVLGWCRAGAGVGTGLVLVLGSGWVVCVGARGTAVTWSGVRRHQRRQDSH